MAHKNDKNLQLVYEVYIRRDCQVTLTFCHVTLLVTPAPPTPLCHGVTLFQTPPTPLSVTYFLNGPLFNYHAYSHVVLFFTSRYFIFHV